MKFYFVTLPVLLVLVPAEIVVSTVHYLGYIAAEWLHLYVFEPAERRLMTAIGRRMGWLE